MRPPTRACRTMLTIEPSLRSVCRKGKGTMWANIGISQVHLPVGDPQVIPGKVYLRFPDLDVVRDRLKGTEFTWYALFV